MKFSIDMQGVIQALATRSDFLQPTKNRWGGRIPPIVERLGLPWENLERLLHPAIHATHEVELDDSPTNFEEAIEL